jgi:mono/diheme cytochrome c family protein
MKFVNPMLMLLLAILGVGCEIGPQSGSGLRLPNGDVVAGKQAFVDLGCNACHEVGDQAGPVEAPGGRVMVRLGGKSPHIETHGELVTSIVNPSHGFPRRYAREDVTEGNQSRMRNFNDTMTVAQLIDLTTYIQSKYDLELNEIYAP